jgi:hypothetical protein
MRWFGWRTRPGDSFFDNPGVAFDLNLESAGPLDYVTTGEFTRPEQVGELVSAMEKHRTQYVFLYPQLYGPFHDGDNLGPFRNYVYKNYHLVRIDPLGQVWQRNLPGR